MSITGYVQQQKSLTKERKAEKGDKKKDELKGNDL